jgi:hypothetical protein
MEAGAAPAPWSRGLDSTPFALNPALQGRDVRRQEEAGPAVDALLAQVRVPWHRPVGSRPRLAVIRAMAGRDLAAAPSTSAAGWNSGCPGHGRPPAGQRTWSGAGHRGGTWPGGCHGQNRRPPSTSGMGVHVPGLATRRVRRALCGRLSLALLLVVRVGLGQAPSTRPLPLQELVAAGAAMTGHPCTARTRPSTLQERIVEAKMLLVLFVSAPQGQIRSGYCSSSTPSACRIVLWVCFCMHMNSR